MKTQVREEITLRLSPEQMQAVENLAAIARSGGFRDPEMVQGLAATGQLQYGARPTRSFMHPDAARLFGEKGRNYLGNKVFTDWARSRSQRFSQPDRSDVHIDAAMTQVSIAYRNEMYIGTQVFPRVQVVKASDKYFIFDKGPWLRDEARPRAVGGQFARGGYTLSNDNYSCEEFGFECPVDDRIRRNADNPLNPDRHATEFASDKIDLNLERKIATLVFTGGNWSNSTSPTDWDNSGGAPFTDFKTARLTVLSETGRMPNTVVIGIEAYEVLALHDDLLDRIKYTGTAERPAMVTPNMLAQLMGVQRVLIGAGIYDPTTEPAASAPEYIWGKHCWVGYVAPQPAIETPSAGYVFTLGRLVDSYREDPIRGDVMRASEEYDEKVTSADSGYLMTGVVA